MRATAHASPCGRTPSALGDPRTRGFARVGLEALLCSPIAIAQLVALQVLRELAVQDADALADSIAAAVGLDEVAANKVRMELKFGVEAAAPGADSGGTESAEAKGDESAAPSAAAGAAVAADAAGDGDGGGASGGGGGAPAVQPNWAAMPDAMLGTYLLTVITDPKGGQAVWVVNGLQDIVRRCESLDAARLDEFGACGVTLTVCTALTESSESEEIVQAALHALRFLCRAPGNRGVVASSGALLKIVDMMKVFPTNEVVQEMGCAALVNMASVEDNQRVLGENGAGTVVTAAIKNHRLNGRVVWSALAALRNITIFPPNQARMGKEGGIKVVANCLGAHRMDPKINEMGCGTLRNLAVDADNRPKLVAQGGISALALALNAHKENERVQAAGLGALNNLAFEESAREELATEGVAAICKTAKATFPKNMDIKTHAGSILGVLEPKGSGGGAGGVAGKITGFFRK